MLSRAVILLVIALVFFVAPMEAIACDNPSEVNKACCAERNEDRSQSDIHYATKSGVREDTCDHASEGGGQKNGCSENCQHSSCHCVSFQLTQLIVPPHLQADYQSFFYQKEDKFIYTKANTSSGFNTIWQPPKIG